MTLDELHRLIAEAQVLAGGLHQCAALGHKWIFMGGAHCGCDDGCGACSVGVYECESCGDCDYGDNDEADEIRRDCAMRRGE
jgi:hypothetical protein